jgi:hypothetical protein
MNPFKKPRTTGPCFETHVLDGATQEAVDSIIKNQDVNNLQSPTLNLSSESSSYSEAKERSVKKKRKSGRGKGRK